jgi:hypothetical protein
MKNPFRYFNSSPVMRLIVRKLSDFRYRFERSKISPHELSVSGPLRDELARSLHHAGWLESVE